MIFMIRAETEYYGTQTFYVESTDRNAAQERALREAEDQALDPTGDVVIVNSYSAASVPVSAEQILR